MIRYFQVLDPDFPMVAYQISEQELIKLIEQDSTKPLWWKQKYMLELYEFWQQKSFENPKNENN